MKPVTLTVDIEAPTDRVWAELADFGSHPEWMGDAMAIEFITDRTVGVGTQIRVPTRIGPLRTSDVMTVVEWVDNELIAVEHVGAVSGRGRFEISPSGSGTVLRWSEILDFPWWLGGALGAWVARPVLRRGWGRNLQTLKRRLEVSAP